MKKGITKTIMALFAVFILTITISACSADKTELEQQTQERKKTDDIAIVDESDFIQGKNLIETMSKAEISEQEKEGLIQMREEEKLARDVYLTLYDKWSQKTFDNIAASEQTHTDAVKTLLDRYDIEDPVKNDAIGVFSLPAIQKLYDDLTAQGKKSLIEALKVGVTIEDLDIKDLQEFLKTTDNDDIIIVYENLLKGSRNHLRAFVRILENNGGSYTPQYIDAKEYDKIISSEQEKGTVNIKGKNRQ